MRVLHFSTKDLIPGATKAAYEIHRSLIASTIDSIFYTMEKKSNDETVHLLTPYSKTCVNSILFRIYRKYVTSRKFALRKINYGFNDDRGSNIDFRSVFALGSDTIDLIMLHYVAGFLTSNKIRRLSEYFQCPIVWVVMDMEPITGGCHQSFGCEKYYYECGNCPYFGSRKENDLSRNVWKRKNRNLEKVPITFLCPNSWVEDWVKKCSLFSKSRTQLIPLALDTGLLHPGSMQKARNELGIPFDKKVILIGARYLNDPAKGMKELRSSLKVLEQRVSGSKNALSLEDIILLIAGSNPHELLEKLPYRSLYLGILNGKRLTLAYQASDIFACPSLYDAGPLMIPEAMLCGTPVVAFKTGVAIDLITPNETGQIVEHGNIEAYAEALLEMLLLETERAEQYKEASIKKGQTHNSSIVCKQYIKATRGLISSNNNIK